jgi:hypothetical protein
LDQQNEVPLLKMLNQMLHGESPRFKIIGEMLNERQEQLRFQAARYDGDLKGTEVGMVLFYTDLLAKLWLFDYADGAPTRQDIEDFVPLSKIPFSPIYLQELRELPSTRLWFGPRDQGFQMVANGLLLARNATRIYAASSNPLDPGAEVEPNAENAVFLGWWNNHYEEVARFEPQYQRLNEIMKWSLLVSWLGDQGQMDRLSFLEGQAVDHSQWFPEWIKRQPDLRFRKWASVSFLNPRPDTAYKGVTTETIPILYKDFPNTGGDFTLSGGVSLGSEKVFQARAPIREELSGVLRRSHLDYQAVDGLEEGTVRLRTLEKAEINLDEVLGGNARVVAKAKPEAKLRSTDLELRNAPFEIDYRSTSAGLRVDAQAGGTTVGHLSVTPTRNGFAVGFKSLDLEQAGELSRRVVDSVLAGREPLAALASDSRVATVLRTPSSEGYLVRMKGANRWLLLSPEEKPSATIASDVQMRVGGWRDGAQEAPRWTAAWVEDRALPPQLGDGGYLAVEPPAPGGGGVAIEVRDHGPPPGSGSMEFSFEGARVHARRDPSSGGRYIFERKALPEALRKDPSRLRELFDPSGREDLDGRIAGLQRGDYEKVGRELARDPILFKRGLEQYRTAALQEVDRLMAAGRQAEASRILDRLSEAFGNDPDLNLRRALSQLGTGRTPVAVDALEEARAGLRGAGPAIDRIDARLAHGNVPAAEQDALVRVGRGLEMQERTLRDPGLRMDTRFVLGPDNQLDFHVALLDAVRGRNVRVQEIRSRHVYLDVDDPGLHNVDWPASVPPTLPEAVSQRLVVTEIPSWEIAHAQPGALEVAATKHQYRLASKAQSLQGLSRYPSLKNEPCGSATDRQQRADCDPYVYLVTMRPAPAARAAAGR